MDPATDPWAVPGDVRVAWLLDPGELPADEGIALWLGRAKRHVIGLDSGVVARISADPVLAESARDVVVAMVLRVFANPEGLRSYQESEGPMAEQVTYGGETPGQLFLTPDEARLLRMRPYRKQRVFSVPTVKGWG